MLLTPLLSLLAPYECLGCTREGSLLCGDCNRTLRPAIMRCYRCHQAAATPLTCASCRPFSCLNAVYAAVRYEALAKDLIWKLKYGRARSGAAEIGGLLALALSRKDMRSVTYVTHVPTATARVRRRGYDQAALIARAFAAGNGLAYAGLLARQNRSRQVGASQEVRSAQLRGAFRPVRAGRIEGATILLVDDVITTGATLEAAAATLIAAGAKRVEAAVFAQA